MASPRPANTENLAGGSKEGFLFTATLQALLSELTSPLNLIVTLICIYLIYKIFFNSSETSK